MASLSERSTLFWILAFAVLFRALLVPLNRPRLSTDVYRYVWDGCVQGAGINPYLYPPADPHLSFLRDSDICPDINRKEYARTIYPPAAQLFFWLVTRVRGSVTGMKAAMAAADCGMVLILLALLAQAGLPRKRVLAYAWHPLPVWEFAGAGHVDALMLLLTVGAFAALCGPRPALAGGTLAAALYLPYAAQAGSKVLGFLPQYTHEERLTGGDRFYLLRLADASASLVAGQSVRIPPLAFLALALLAYATLVIAFESARKRRSVVARDGRTDPRRRDSPPPVR
ncbi:MAG TPA: hypothetical protein VGD78_14450 [Chthoniobacterales bacterium]